MNLIEVELSTMGIYVGEVEFHQFPGRDKLRCYWEKENMIKSRADGGNRQSLRYSHILVSMERTDDHEQLHVTTGLLA